MQQPPSLSSLRATRKPIKNTLAEHKEKLTYLERFALLISRKVGTMGFFIILVIWTAGWLLWNIIGPEIYRFDPYPAFVLWLFISNMTQLFLLPLIMVGQNLESKYSEFRAQSEYDLNVKSEREIEAVLEHLEYQNGVLGSIVSKLDNRN